jgi:hypothetical protein
MKEALNDATVNVTRRRAVSNKNRRYIAARRGSFSPTLRGGGAGCEGFLR